MRSTNFTLIQGDGVFYLLPSRWQTNFFREEDASAD